KYVHIAVNPRFEEDSIRVSYSITEIVDDPAKLKHPLVREGLDAVGIKKGIEIVSVADAPAATGLGSSGSFCVGLLRALHAYLREEISSQFVAEEACNIAMNRLKEPSGKQDEYVAAFGGIRSYEVDVDGEVKVQPLKLTTNSMAELEANTLMFYTGMTRSSSSVLSKQKTAIEKDGATEKMDRIKEIGYKVRDALASGNLTRFGELLDEHWTVKRGVVSAMTNEKIDHWYKVAKDNGALGGKLCLAPGTLVTTESGYIPIEAVKPGDRVYDCRYILQYVHEVMHRHYEGPILQFTIKGVDEPLVVTPEHPLMTTVKHPGNRREYGQKIVNLPIFKPASAFEKGDALLLPIDDTVDDLEAVGYPNFLETPKYANHFLYEGFPSRIPLSDSFLRLIGWYAAEGSRSAYQIFFALNNNESAIAKQIVEDLGSTFSKMAAVAPNGTGQSIVVRCSSTALSQLVFDLCGDGAEEKHLPDFVMRLRPTRQFVVLRALWLGDGGERDAYDKRTRHSTVRCYYKTVSFRLAKQVQQLCLRLGFVCSLKHEDAPPKRIHKRGLISTRQRAYIISIFGDDAKAFKESLLQDRIVPVSRRNHKGLSLRKDIVRIEGALYSKASVTRVEKRIHEGEVYNLGVGGSHTYIAGDVAVHNCGAGGGGFLMLYSENGRSKLRAAMAKEGLVEHRFHFSPEGSKIIYNV
ncbi:MAG: hypothetical protein JRM99_08040, partial [Nitrososphaerota archaeon]|nr:hypothetical protein [Nitrososphaerota archaeon]